jgi:serine/threonine protein phosphatase PrpC
MASTNVDWRKYLHHAALSDIGMRRANNQDSYSVVLAGDAESWARRGHLFIVADGMGGEAAGELASKIAVDNIPHLYHKATNASPPEALQTAIKQTNAEINRRGEANPDFHRMGTTVVCLLILPQGALLGHVGDSRIYRLRGDKLEQLTFDHSLVWEMRAAGQLDGDPNAATAVPKNWITRSLGPKPEVKVDIEGPLPTLDGDTFLLCSDGLTGEVKDEEIGPILRHLPPEAAAQALIDLANLRGGPDNITVEIIRLVGRELTSVGSAAEPLTVGQSLEPPKGAHPAWWAGAGVLALMAGLLAVVDQPIIALVSVIGAMIVGTVGLLLQFGNFGSKGVELKDGRRLGRGPYTKTDCGNNEQVARELESLVGELFEAVESDAGINAPEAKTPAQQGKAALEKDHFDEAVKHFCRAIEVLMQALRGVRQQRRASDSTVDL